MPPVRTGPIIGLITQIVLLAVLSATTGLGAAGWLLGLGYGVVTCLTLSHGLHRAAARGLGPADWVTLVRATLVGAVTALTVEEFRRPAPVTLLVAIGTVALLLDLVDGKVARRTGSASALGARFDMEVDAFLILVLSVSVARGMGAWVLTIGGMRYAYVAASWVLPWLRGSLPDRYWRKVVAAVQGIVLMIATAGVFPLPLMVGVVAGSLALLIESFGRDVAWLWRHRVAEPRPVIDPRRVIEPRHLVKLEHHRLDQRVAANSHAFGPRPS